MNKLLTSVQKDVYYNAAVSTIFQAQFYEGGPLGSITFDPLTPREEARDPLGRKLSGPQSRSGRSTEEQIQSLPEI